MNDFTQAFQSLLQKNPQILNLFAQQQKPRSSSAQDVDMQQNVGIPTVQKSNNQFLQQLMAQPGITERLNEGTISLSDYLQQKMTKKYDNALSRIGSIFGG